MTPVPFADPDVAARKLVKVAKAIEPVQDGRRHVELINGYRAGIERAISKDWLWRLA